MTPPKYQTITNERIPKYILPEQAGVVEVIAGEYEGTKGAATTFTEIEMYNIRLNPGARIQFSLPEEYNTGILVIEGQVRVNDTDDAPEDYFVLFRNKGERISVSTASGGLLLVLSGKPLRESIMAYGPFLMNTKDEILQAFDDLNAGKFGELED